jgi:hypothetical protein
VFSLKYGLNSYILFTRLRGRSKEYHQELSEYLVLSPKIESRTHKYHSEIHRIQHRRYVSSSMFSVYFCDRFGVYFNCVLYEVLKAASMKMTAFWDISSCSLVEVDRRSRGTNWINHQGALMITRLDDAISQKAVSLHWLFSIVQVFFFVYLENKKFMYSPYKPVTLFLYTVWYVRIVLCRVALFRLPSGSPALGFSPTVLDSLTHVCRHLVPLYLLLLWVSSPVGWLILVPDSVQWTSQNFISTSFQNLVSTVVDF